MSDSPGERGPVATGPGRGADAGGSHSSGFACLVGRPNVGKSTLLNALVGEKLAITSDKPQTTRRILRGVVRRELAEGGRAELVLVDTPGAHRPRTLLGERLNELVRDGLAEVDVAVLCLPADATVGPGDRMLAATVAAARPGSVVVAVTRADLGRGDAVARQLLAAQALAEQAGLDVSHIVPTSGRRGDGVETLAGLLCEALPVGPALFGDEVTTDTAVDVLVAELVREAALDGVRDELPHSLAAVTEEIEPRAGRDAARPLTDVRVELFVERDSQKGIVIGRGGARLKAVGSRARRGIEGLLGTQVNLDLRVKVAKEWQRDPKQLRRLGLG